MYQRPMTAFMTAENLTICLQLYINTDSMSRLRLAFDYYNNTLKLQIFRTIVMSLKLITLSLLVRICTGRTSPFTYCCMIADNAALRHCLVVPPLDLRRSLWARLELMSFLLTQEFRLFPIPLSVCG